MSGCIDAVWLTLVQMSWATGAGFTIAAGLHFIEARDWLGASVLLPFGFWAVAFLEFNLVP